MRRLQFFISGLMTAWALGGAISVILGDTSTERLVGVMISAFTAVLGLYFTRLIDDIKGQS
jgi:hypothetical protein